MDYTHAQVQIGANANQLETGSIPIPNNAHIGTAYGYANVYSDFPQNGGYPLSQEQPFTFTIAAGANNVPASGSAPSNSGSAGTYSMTFTIPQTGGTTLSGTYTVYASGSWSGYYGTATTTFNVQFT